MTGLHRRLSWTNALYILRWTGVLAFYFMGVCCCQNMGNKEQMTICLSDFYPDQRETEEILEEERKEKEPVEVCFFKEYGFIEITRGDGAVKTQAMTAGIMGNAVEYDWRASGFDSMDTEGCVIDRGTAVELFGSAQPGGIILVGGRTCQVRMVLPWKNRRVLFAGYEGETKADRIFVRNGCEKKEIRQFLMRHGLSGKILSDRWMKNIVLLILLVLPAGILKSFYQMAAKEQKSMDNSKIYGWLWGFARLAVILVGIGCIWYFFKIPEEWIPGKWSDFAFWHKKITETAEEIRLYFVLSKTEEQNESILYGIKSVFCFLVSVLGMCYNMKYSV